MSKALYFVAFVSGAAIGGFAAWKYTQKKYEQIAQEDIDSVKETFRQRVDELTGQLDKINEEKKDVAAKAKDKPDVVSYTSMLNNLGYTDESTHAENPDRPYVISPDEFDEFDEYDKRSLIYYADGYLADDNDELVDDVEETVGSDSLNHFGEYEYDSVFVRNDRLKCDYEILLSLRKYSEANERKFKQQSQPYRIEED